MTNESFLQIGDKLKDNDPRSSSRGLLSITELDDMYVWASRYGRTFRILRRRIYTDGKTRRSGFSKVTP